MGCSTCFEPVAMMATPPVDVSKPFHVGPPAEYDHEPQPVPLVQLPRVRYRCEFCTSTEPVWLYEVRQDLTFSTVVRNYTADTQRQRLGRDHEVVSKVPARLALEGNVSHFTGGWITCQRCADVIELDDVNRLVTHVRRTLGDALQSTRRQAAERFGAFLSQKVGRRPLVTESATPAP